MQLFLESLRRRALYLHKALRTEDVQVSLANDVVTVTATWGTITKKTTFTARDVLGDTAKLPRLQQRCVQPLCRFVDNIVTALKA